MRSEAGARLGTRAAAILLLSPVVGCASVGTVRALAADDFSCPADSITITENSGYGRTYEGEPNLGTRVFRAAGCNLVATYACLRNTSDEGGPPLCVRAGDGGSDGASGGNGASDGASDTGSEPAPTSRIPTGAFPPGAAGFAFGSSPADAGTRCTAAGHIWTPGMPGTPATPATPATEPDFTCDHAPASVGLDASVRARFCAGALCGVRILTHDPGQTGWTKQFLRMRDEIEKRYGTPTNIASKVPNECLTALPRCLAEGTASFRVTWTWADRGSIALSLGKSEGQVSMRLSYKQKPGLAL